MGRIQGGYPKQDSARSALVVAGFAMAVGSAALFAIVAHTRTPFFSLDGTRTAPPDSPPASQPLIPLSFAKRKFPGVIADEPSRAEVQDAESGHAAAPEALLPGESVVVARNLEAVAGEVSPVEVKSGEAKPVD